MNAAFDTIALSIAATAGTILMALAVNQYDPMLQWSLAIIAGGVTAATMRGVSSLTRLISTVTSGGLSNFIVAIAELVGAMSLSLLALTTPYMVVGVVAVMFGILIWLLIRVRQIRNEVASSSEQA